MPPTAIPGGCVARRIGRVEIAPIRSRPGRARGRPPCAGFAFRRRGCAAAWSLPRTGSPFPESCA